MSSLGPSSFEQMSHRHEGGGMRAHETSMANDGHEDSFADVRVSDIIVTTTGLVS